MTAHYDVFETHFGWMGLLASSRGLRRSTLPQDSPGQCLSTLAPEADGASHAPETLAVPRDLLERYFSGRPVEFDDVAIDVEDASPFLRRAWDACRTIPIGETRTYRWLAAQAGRPRAPRAAGQSMARNRLPIIVPCHRVLSSDGRLGGFGRGASQLDLKQRLLDLEAGTARAGA